MNATSMGAIISTQTSICFDTMAFLSVRLSATADRRGKKSASIATKTSLVYVTHNTNPAAYIPTSPNEPFVPAMNALTAISAPVPANPAATYETPRAKRALPARRCDAENIFLFHGKSLVVAWSAETSSANVPASKAQGIPSMPKEM